jgi:hypothetical protein
VAGSRLFAVTLLAAFPCFAQFPNETDRLMAIAKLWVTVEYFHPYLAYRDIDWDQALINAIPKIRAAKDTNEYRVAVSSLLDELHDPETYVLPDREGEVISTGGGAPRQVSYDVSPQFFCVRTAAGTAFLTAPGKHFGPLSIGQFSVSLGEYGKLSADYAALAQAGLISISSSAKHYQIESTEKMFVDLSGMQAVVRLSEPWKPVPIQAGTPATNPETAIPPAPLIPRLDTRFSDPYPSTEARLLAAIKTWGAIHYFFAYKDLMDEDWDDLFPAYLPKFWTLISAKYPRVCASACWANIPSSPTFSTPPRPKLVCMWETW